MWFVACGASISKQFSIAQVVAFSDFFYQNYLGKNAGS